MDRSAFLIQANMKRAGSLSIYCMWCDKLNGGLLVSEEKFSAVNLDDVDCRCQQHWDNYHPNEFADIDAAVMPASTWTPNSFPYARP